MSEHKPVTLSGMFSPPEGMVGQLAVTCAYSAGRAFMEQMLTSFTRRGPKSRQLEGCADIFLMVDPSCPVIDLRQIPGLVCMHPRSRQIWKDNITIQHAKVALLRFGKSRQGPGEKWRLIVSTGNWTEESALRNIEMIWSEEYSITDNEGPLETPQIVRDMSEAACFLKNLSCLYAVDILLWKQAGSFLETVIKKGEPVKHLKSRFFSTLPSFENNEILADSRERGVSIADGVVDRFCDGAGQRNFIQCGSGFFEQASDGAGGKKPKAIARIEEMLVTDLKNRKKTGLVQRPYKTLVVNPSFCGQVSQWGTGAGDDGWDIYQPWDPSEGNRSILHAKYLLIGKLQNGSGRMDRGKIYVGSGNLSLMGFFSAFGRTPGQGKSSAPGQGNIEAGIIFDLPSEITGDLDTLNHALGVGDKWDAGSVTLEPGEGEETISAEFIEPPPLSRFEIVDEGTDPEKPKVRPVWASDLIKDRAGDSGGIDIFLPGGATAGLKIGEDTSCVLSGPAPAWICVKWQGRKWEIPVLTQDGAFVSQKIMLSGMDELFALLIGFPDLAVDDEMIDGKNGDGDSDFSENPDPGGQGGSGETTPNGVERRPYPLSSSMQFIERIADLNQLLPVGGASESREDSPFLKDWIFQLEHLLDCLPDWQIEEWKSLEINFLDVLKADHFAPPGASGKWECFVDRLARKWELDHFDSIFSGNGMGEV